MNTKSTTLTVLCSICCTILVLLAAGCKRADKEVIETKTVVVDTENFAPVDSFFTDWKYVMLQSSDEVLINDDTEYRTSDKYIIAYSQDRGFYAFDMAGKLVSAFNKYGEGPGEYLDITDYYISDNDIFAVDRIKNKVMKYNILSGDVVSEIPLPDTYMYLAPLGSSHMVLSPAYCSARKFNFSVLDVKDKNIVADFMPYKNYESCIFSDFTAFVGQGKDCVYGVVPYSHTLYRISETGCQKAYEFTFNSPDQYIPAEEEADICRLSDEYRYKRVVKWLGQYTETSSGAHYQSFELLCNYGIQPFLCKFSSEGGKAITLRIGAKRFEQFPYLTVPPVEFSNGKYVCVAEAERLLHAEEIVGKDTFSSQGLTEDSNPVVFFYTLK